MFDRKYKKLRKLMEDQMESYHYLYEFYSKKDDAEDRTYWFTRYYDIKRILEKFDEKK